MAEQLHKGWLNTRDNEKFAPATLATQIYNEDGTSFYTTVSNYIKAQDALSDALENLTTGDVADLKTDLRAEAQARAAKDQELESQLQYFDGSADSALYIIDKNANIIAYVDGSGVNSTDFTIPTSGIRLSNVAAHVNDLQSSVESILTKLAYFDGAADNAFFIVDNNKNVIAYIDGSGVHSTNFFTTETDFNSLVARINAIETTDLSAINQAIKKLQDTDTALTGSIETLTSRLSHFNGDADNAFYIIDKNQNVVAYIKEGGVYSVDFIPDEGRTHKELDEAFDSHIEQYVEDKSVQAGVDKRQDDSITALSESVEKLSAYFNTDPDDTFYIIDKDKNVIAYIREGGVYSTNFTLKDGRNLVTLYDDYERILADAETYNTFNTIETWIESAIQTLGSHTQSLKDLGDSIENVNTTLLEKINANTENISSNDEDISALEQKVQYFNGSADEALYIVDQTEDHNVIAVVNGQGIKSIDFATPQVSLNATAANLATLTTDVIGEYPGDIQLSEDKTVSFPSGKTIFYLIAENWKEIQILTAGNDSPGSVAYQIAQIIAGADESYDTLKEIADWIIAHPEDVAAMWKQINHNQSDIKAIYSVIGEKSDEELADPGSDTLWSNVEDINRVFNNDSDDTIYIVDNNKNVVAYFNQNGLTTMDVIMGNNSIRGLGYSAAKSEVITLNFDI